MMNAVRFGAVYRLVDKGQPLTDETRGKAVYDQYQQKHNYDGVLLTQRAGKDQPPQNHYIMTSPEKESFMQRVGLMMKKAMEAMMSGKDPAVVQQELEAETTAMWQDASSQASDLDVNSL